MRAFCIVGLVIFSALMGCGSLNKELDKKELAQSNGVQRGPASHTWANYHWARTANPFNLKAGDNLTLVDWKGYFSQAVSDWNSPDAFGATDTPINLVLTAGRSSKRCSMVSGTVQVCNGKYGNNGWLGLASINIVNGEHITQGSSKMNDTYFATATYNNKNEKLHVMCQEIAHTFGLSHQSEDGSSQNSCMDYFSNTGVNATSTLSTRPNAHDFEQLNAIYSHVDSTNTASPMAVATSVSDVTDDPKSWGEHMRERSHGRHGYYRARNRDGSETITHVYWTEEQAGKCKDCDHRD